MKTTVNVNCSCCGKNVIKLQTEVKRRTKIGKTQFYCNNKCAGKHKSKHTLPYRDNFTKTKYIRKPDKFSDFRWYLKQIKKGSNKKNLIFNIDIEYLKQLWNEQKGECPFTKQKLILRTHYNYKDTKIAPNIASLDRMDSTQGYVKGNVRFVCLIYNYAKNIFTDQEVILFCHQVTENNNEFLEKVV